MSKILHKVKGIEVGLNDNGDLTIKNTKSLGRTLTIVGTKDGGFIIYHPERGTGDGIADFVGRTTIKGLPKEEKDRKPENWIGM